MFVFDLMQKEKKEKGSDERGREREKREEMD